MKILKSSSVHRVNLSQTKIVIFQLNFEIVNGKEHHAYYQSINQGVIAQFYILVGAWNLTLEFSDQNAINPKALYGTTKVCY